MSAGNNRSRSGVDIFVLGVLFLATVILAGGGLGLLLWLGTGIFATSFWIAYQGETVTRQFWRRAGGAIIAFAWALGLLVVFARHGDGGHTEMRRHTKCASNLRQIGQAMLLYANDNGGHYPDRPETLLFTQDMTAEVFTCPSTGDSPARGPTTRDISDEFASGGHLSYVYLGKGRTHEPDASLVLAYESAGNHAGERIPGINVLFGDGHVEWIDQPAANALIAELQAGHNPPKQAK